MLRTRDLKSTIDFYVGVLGFTLNAGGDVDGWAMVSRDGLEIMVARPNDHEPFERPAFTGSLYLRVDEVDAEWNRLATAAPVCYPIETFDYGMREFAIYDVNGYLIQVGQEVSSHARGNV
jgi:catechol 2,3-dioxygenase-like lactoylglutathione lyase family enzyme